METTGGVYLVPAFAGLGAPHWDDRARGILSGLTRGAGPAQLARAALESIAYQVHDVFDVMTRGFGVMLPYADRVEPRDRWAIVGYVRALQRSQHASLADVPESQRRQLTAP